MTYHERWAKAYTLGHNLYKLRGARLAHFATAYADLTEGVAYPLPPDTFYMLWDLGDVYEGVPDPGGEHWRERVA